MVENLSSELANLSLCVVEPDSAVREGIRDFLHTHQLSVVTHASARQLLRHASVAPVDAVLSAAELPDGTAVDLYQELLLRQCECRFAITVSSHQRQLIEHAVEAGIVTILHKPLLPGSGLLDFALKGPTNLAR